MRPGKGVQAVNGDGEQRVDTARAGANGRGALGATLEPAALGDLPPPDGGVEFVPQPSERELGVVAFTAHTVVFADAGAQDTAALRALLPPGDLSAPHPAP